MQLRVGLSFDVHELSSVVSVWATSPIMRSESQRFIRKNEYHSSLLAILHW